MQVRPLGFFETILYHAHQYGNSQMSLWVRLEGPVEPVHFDKAFQCILAKHPLLRSTIEKMHGVLSFRIHDSPQHIPIAHLRKKNETHFETVFEEIASQQMSLDKHNIAATVLHKQKDLNTYECDLMIHISHVVADGLSIFNLVSEIIEHIEHQISGNILSAISQPLPKPVEQCLKKKLSIPDYFKVQEDLNPKPEVEQLNMINLT